MGWDRFGDEGAARDNGIASHHGFAAEHARIRVNGHVVLDGGMALHACELLPRSRGKRAEGNALVDLDVVADDGRFADDHAGGVIDEEVLADGGSRVDVDAGAAMGVLGHDAGNERHILRVELMVDAIHEDGEETRVGEDDLLLALRCRVAIEGGLNVGQQNALNFRKLAEEV